MTMTMEGLGTMAIGVLVLIVAFTIIPIVGDQLDQAVSIPFCKNATEFQVDGDGTCPESGIAVGGTWNSAMDTDIPTGVDLWTSVGGILKVAGIIVVVAGFLRTLQGMKSGN